MAAAERRGGQQGRARLYDWARVRLVRLQEPPWDHWLLVRRSIADPTDLAYFVVFGPAGLRLVDLARVAGRRWLVEECFEAAKQEVGLADYEVRSWHGWHRHVTLAMLVVRGRQKVPSGWKPLARDAHLRRVGRGYDLSASHH